MTTPFPVVDARLLASDPPAAATAYDDHRALAPAPDGGLACPDTALDPLRREVPAPDVGVPARLVVTGGAGAIGPALHHAQRSAHVAVVGLVVALRDEDDLARNAERVVRALDLDLPDAMPATVVLPRTSHQGASWLAAADAVTAVEHGVGLRVGGVHGDLGTDELAAVVDACLDRETALTLVGGDHTTAARVLRAARGLLDGASRADVAGADAAGEHALEPDEVARTTRWLAALHVTDPALLTRPAG